MCPQILRPLVIAGLVIVTSACQPQRSAIETRNIDTSFAGHVGQSVAGPIGVRPAAYFGDVFSREEAALTSKPPESASPTF